jgi:hypothetical protein
MTGPSPHPVSGIFQFRKAIPSDLKKQQAAIKALKLPYSNEIHRSLKTRDKKEAERKYAEVSLEVEAMWASWRRVLKTGRTALSERDAAALAGYAARGLVEKNQANPSQVVFPDFDYELMQGLRLIDALLGQPKIYMGDFTLEVFLEITAVNRLELPAYLNERILEAGSEPFRLAYSLAAILHERSLKGGWHEALSFDQVMLASLSKEALGLREKKEGSFLGQSIYGASENAPRGRLQSACVV